MTAKVSLVKLTVRVTVLRLRILALEICLVVTMGSRDADPKLLYSLG